MAVSLLFADSPAIGTIFGPPQWGIYDQGGAPVIAVDAAAMVEADAVAAVQYARDYRVPDYAQEQGSFETYNKVQSPFSAQVSFWISQSRFEFLAAVEAACASLDLYVVVVPEWSYPSANLIHYSFNRDVRQGVTLIRVDVWLKEIRVTNVSPGTTGQLNSGNTQAVNGAIPSYSGTVQAVPPTVSQGQGGLSTL